jgi:predicted acyl esterase
VPAWPRVRLEIRERAGAAEERCAERWPLPQTRYQPMWLDAGSGRLGPAAVKAPACIRYDARNGRAVFDHTFDRPTELTGHAKLRLWIEADGSDDMDLFVALQKLDVDGREVGMTFYAFYDNGPVALGWLRASHRALDAARSTEWQPLHPHTVEQRLEPGAIVPVDIEIWPSATLFAAGDSLRVVVQGSDVYKDALPRLPFARHEDTRNAGTHALWTGGNYDSHLLVPVIAPPAARGA